MTVSGLSPGSLGAWERRRAITLVGVRSPILAGSLRRALTMGAAERPDDPAILAQAEVFGLRDVIDRLGGLDGRLAEGGRNLSAGEVRRVLLTRAALSSSRLLLLDEPDDALDADGPALVERLMRQTEATTILVTHNLTLAQKTDRLWFFESGRVTESGAPGVLLAGGGPTAQFFVSRTAA